MPETKYHVEITLLGGEKRTFDNCSCCGYNNCTTFSITTEDHKTINFYGVFSVVAIPMEDYNK